MSFQFPTNLEFIANITLFLILFAITNWLLRKSRIFYDSKGIQLIISTSSAFLALYGLIKANFSISELLFKFNLSEAFQYNFFVLTTLILIAIIWIKLKTGKTLIVLGTLIFLTGILKVFYINSGLISAIGIILLILGIILIKRNSFREKFNSMSLKDQADYKLKKRK